MAKFCIFVETATPYLTNKPTSSVAPTFSATYTDQKKFNDDVDNPTVLCAIVNAWNTAYDAYGGNPGTKPPRP